MFVQDVVPWRNSRRILYWRLRRLLLENQIKSQMLNIQPNLSVGQAEAMLRRWFVEDKDTTVVS
jgi:acetyl-CoA carboxylase/biotin carboxylase 1